MRAGARFRSWLRATLHRSRMEREMESELRFHIENFTEDLMRMGVPIEEARRRAGAEFGAVEARKEECREALGLRLFDEFRADLRYAFRMLRKAPAFTTVAILSLALGIGANTAVFTIYDAVSLKSLPFKDARRLIAIWESDPKRLNTTGIWNSYRDFTAWCHDKTSVEELAAYSWVNASPILRGKGAPRGVFAVPVTPNFFSLLGEGAMLGRAFSQQDKMGAPLVVLSHSFWQTQLGGSASAIGSTLELDRKPYTVVGVMPPNFKLYPREMQMWRLMTPDDRFIKDPKDHSLVVFGRLRPGTSVLAAQGELTAIRANSVKSDPDGVSEFVPIVHSMQQDFVWLVGRNLSRTLVLLFGAVAFLLLIACLNVANLLLTRCAERRKELAVRAALGSGRRRMLQQLLTEYLLLSVLGTGLGVLLAGAAIQYFRTMNPVELPPGNPLSMDFRVLAFSIALGIFTVVICGLVPAWRASKIDLNDSLKDANRGSGIVGLSSRGVRSLAVLEIALSLVLLVGAGLLIQSMNRMAHASIGFRPDHLLDVHLDLTGEHYANPEQVLHFYGRLTEQMRRSPSIEGVELSSGGPLTSWGNDVVAIEGRPAPAPNVSFGDCGSDVVSATYFHLMQVPLVAGRSFDFRDRMGSEFVAIVNESFAQRYFPTENPLGRHVRIGTPLDRQPWLKIIGIVGNIKGPFVFREMTWWSGPMLYRPTAQEPKNSEQMLIRYSGDPQRIVAVAQREVGALDPDIPVGSTKSVEDMISAYLKYPGFRAWILGLFAAIAVLLATIGTYGVVCKAVESSTREIAIRMAVGATQHNILVSTAQQGILLGFTGALIGLTGSLVLARSLTSLLYDIAPTDPLTLAIVTIGLCSLTIIASLVPARRASRVDPMVALRCG